MWELEKTEVKDQSWEGSLPWSNMKSHVGWTKERMEVDGGGNETGCTEELPEKRRTQS